jgi:hypothetical protein
MTGVFDTVQGPGCFPTNTREVRAEQVLARLDEVNNAGSWSPCTPCAVRSVKDGVVKRLRASSKTVIDSSLSSKLRQREARDGSWTGYS